MHNFWTSCPVDKKRHSRVQVPSDTRFLLTRKDSVDKMSKDTRSPSTESFFPRDFDHWGRRIRQSKEKSFSGSLGVRGYASPLSYFRALAYVHSFQLHLNERTHWWDMDRDGKRGQDHERAVERRTVREEGQREGKKKKKEDGKERGRR